MIIFNDLPPIIRMSISKLVVWTLPLLVGCGVVPVRAAVPIDLSWVDTGSPAYTRFKARADQAVAGNPGYNFSAVEAAYMFRITGQSQYCQLAATIAEAQVAAAEQQIQSGNKPAISRDSYLYVGRELPDVAIAMDWCPNFVTAAQRQRWKAYGDQAIWNVWNYENASWGGRPYPWSGWSVNNPGNNYHYSFLNGTLFWALAMNQTFGENIYSNGFESSAGQSHNGLMAGPGDTNWLPFLAEEKIPPLRAYFASLPGGGSREGTAYGVSQRELFEFYRLWQEASGQDIANASPHATDTIRYWVHATVPTLDRFAPFGDQVMSGRDKLADYHRHVILEASKVTSNSAVRQMASWWLHSTVLDGTNAPVNRVARPENTRQDLLPNGGGGAVPTELVYRAEGAGHLFARTAWNASAMWMSFAAGTFDESHAAQEQGGFSLFSGTWLSWTANMYSNSHIVQQTPAYNVVRFERNGQVIPQRRDHTAGFTLNETGPGGLVDATANLTPHYDGAITGWQRNIRFENRKLTVRDTWSAPTGTTATFQVNTPVQPVINGREAIAGRLKVRVISPADAVLTRIDWRTQNLEGYSFSDGWRLDVRGSGGEFVVELSEVN